MDSNRIPSFDGTPVDLDRYIRDVQLWAMSTPLRPDQRASALVLRLTGKAKALTQNVNMDEIGFDTGVDYLMDFLRAHIRISNMHYAFDVFQKLMRLKRDSQALGPATGDIDTYITEFFTLGQRLHEIGIVIPEPLTTLLLIENASLSARERNLIETILLSREQEALSFDRATNALRQILRHRKSEEATEVLLTQDSEMTEDEIDENDMINDKDLPFEINYVRKSGKFFRRYPRKFRDTFRNRRYGGGKSSSSQNWQSWSPFSKGKSKGKFSHFPAGKRGYGKSKGKSNLPVYAVEEKPCCQHKSSSSTDIAHSENWDSAWYTENAYWPESFSDYWGDDWSFSGN